jgi:hypothetical protein
VLLGVPVIVDVEVGVLENVGVFVFVPEGEAGAVALKVGVFVDVAWLDSVAVGVAVYVPVAVFV